MEKRHSLWLGLLCLCLCLAPSLWAQNSLTLSAADQAGKIYGVLTDSATGEPLPCASVVLQYHNTTYTVDSTATDDCGQFAFYPIPGAYDMAFSTTGYSVKSIVQVLVSQQMPEVKVETVTLRPVPISLLETMAGPMPILKKKVDRSNHQTPTNTAGNGLDVAPRRPFLSIDGKGYVRLQGSSHMRVFLDGNSLPMLPSSLQDDFIQMSSGQLDSLTLQVNDSLREKKPETPIQECPAKTGCRSRQITFQLP